MISPKHLIRESWNPTETSPETKKTLKEQIKDLNPFELKSLGGKAKSNLQTLKPNL